MRPLGGTQPQAGLKVTLHRGNFYGDSFPSPPPPELVNQRAEKPQKAPEAHRLGPSAKPGVAGIPRRTRGISPGAHGLGAPEVPAVLRGVPRTPPPRGLSDSRRPRGPPRPLQPPVSLWSLPPRHRAPASHAHPDAAMVAPRLRAPRRHFVLDGKSRFPLKDTALNLRVWGRPGGR